MTPEDEPVCANQELPDVQDGFGKGRRLEIRLPTFIGPQRKQGNSRKIFASASLTMQKPLTVWITKTVEHS